MARDRMPSYAGHSKANNADNQGERHGGCGYEAHSLPGPVYLTPRHSQGIQYKRYSFPDICLSSQELCQRVKFFTRQLFAIDPAETTKTGVLQPCQNQLVGNLLCTIIHLVNNVESSTASCNLRPVHSNQREAVFHFPRQMRGHRKQPDTDHLLFLDGRASWP